MAAPKCGKVKAAKIMEQCVASARARLSAVCRNASAPSFWPTSEADAVAAVFVISGPSGAGKGTIIALVKQKLDHVATSVSATTRRPRPGEVHGRGDYFFLRRAAFESAVAAGEFTGMGRV